MEISCVYIFDCPRKHMYLLQQLIDVGSNPAIREEDDAECTRSKQRMSKRKKGCNNHECSKKPRK